VAAAGPRLRRIVVGDLARGVAAAQHHRTGDAAQDQHDPDRVKDQWGNDDVHGGILRSRRAFVFPHR